MRRGAPVLRLLVSIAVAALCGCASTEAGFGLPVLDADDAQAAIASGAAEPASLAGTLHVESNGCFTWTAASGADDGDGAWIVWPAEARQDGDVVVLGSGARVGENDDLEVVGAVVTLDDLPDGATPGFVLRLVRRLLRRRRTRRPRTHGGRQPGDPRCSRLIADNAHYVNSRREREARIGTFALPDPGFGLLADRQMTVSSGVVLVD